MKRRKFLAMSVGSLAVAASWQGQSQAAVAVAKNPRPTNVKVALVQFDAVPEQSERNRTEMRRLTLQAAKDGARWVLFHEGLVMDYTGRLEELAEAVPDGASTRFFAKLAQEANMYISFGLSERDGDRFYITQVFVGPQGFVHRYRKTWIWYMPDARAGEWVGGFRNEWDRYDPGTGPERFEIDGVSASCYICADGNSQRCLARIRKLKPDVVFFPNNRSSMGDPSGYARHAKLLGAPLLVPNRVGKSWVRECDGGSVVYGGDGAVLAQANRQGREEILIHTLQFDRA